MGMLQVVQMLVLHDATMTQSGHLAVSEDLPQTESHANMVNKFARTFTHQMDTLHRWRSAPEQKVTVNNVSVSGGGQAIVGHVTQNTGGSGQMTSRTPPPTLTDQSGTAMPIIQPDEQSATTVPRIEQDQEPAPSATRRRRSK